MTRRDTDRVMEELWKTIPRSTVRARPAHCSASKAGGRVAVGRGDIRHTVAPRCDHAVIPCVSQTVSEEPADTGYTRLLRRSTALVYLSTSVFWKQSLGLLVRHPPHAPTIPFDCPALNDATNGVADPCHDAVTGSTPSEDASDVSNQFLLLDCLRFADDVEHRLSNLRKCNVFNSARSLGLPLDRNTNRSYFLSLEAEETVPVSNKYSPGRKLGEDFLKGGADAVTRTAHTPGFSDTPNEDVFMNRTLIGNDTFDRH